MKKETKDTTNQTEKLLRIAAENAVRDMEPQEAQKTLNALYQFADDYTQIQQYKELIEAELKKQGYTGDCYLLAGSKDTKEQELFWKALNTVKSYGSKDKESAMRVTAKRLTQVDFPLDKLNFVAWGLTEEQAGEQLSVKMEKKNSLQKINMYYSIDFDDLKGIQISKTLTPFDKRVYIAIGALFSSGNEVVTTTQIYHAMGSTGTPGPTIRERIDASLTKMLAAKISVDNSEEATSYKYDKFVYESSLLPMERISAYVNGKFTDSAIHLFREPPLLTFARQRKQITTFNLKLLQSPIGKTDINLAIDDYLLTRISKARRKENYCKILYTAICEYLNVDKESPTNQKNIKKRLPHRVQQYLDYYIEADGIKSYTAEKDGVTICF